MSGRSRWLAVLSVATLGIGAVLFWLLREPATSTEVGARAIVSAPTRAATSAPEVDRAHPSGSNETSAHDRPGGASAPADHGLSPDAPAHDEPSQGEREARAPLDAREPAPEPDAPAQPQPPPREKETRARVSRDEVRAAVEAVKPRVRDCYERALEGDPSLAGRVIVQLEIQARDGEGVVARGEVPESEAFSPVFEACVLQEVAGATFPAPEGDGTLVVRYPFSFDPGGGWGGAPPPASE